MPLENLGQIKSQLALVTPYWWVFLPLFFGYLLLNVWVAYVRAKYKSGVTQTILEIRIPREILKTPKAMEQILAGIHGLRNSPSDWIEAYIDGETTMWFSLEVISFSGDVHFYIRTPTRHRNIIESLFYAQYPDIEIAEVPDYIKNFPKSMSGIYESGYDLWGTELKLAKEDAFPIRTYEDFKSVVEEETLDPVSTLLEVLGKMQRGEKLFLQILARPADDTWLKEGEKVLQELKVTTAKGPKKTRVNSEGAAEDFETTVARTPGELEMLKAMARNVSKPGYEIVIRYAYIAPKEVFNVKFPWYGVFTCFNQYAAAGMNSFKHDPKARTLASYTKSPYIFPMTRLEGKKRRMWKYFRDRHMPEFVPLTLNKKSKVFVLNIEELATIWHLPSHAVLTAPFVKRVESRKIGPPAGLPIFGKDGQETPWSTKKET